MSAILRSAGLAGLALLLLAGLSPSRIEAQTSVPQQQVLDPAPPEQVSSGVRAVLSKYGSFVQHVSYGEVWVPTATPLGWHPYPPCQWVRTKQFGWYFDDPSDWGRIVHHYGRWANDPQMGWVWAPGLEFSPGWVAWRTNANWVGWVPLPPMQNFERVSADQFNNSDDWIFMEAAKFAAGCDSGGAAPAGQIATILQSTTYVRQLEYADGILIFVLPPAIIGPVIDVQIGFEPWSPLFLAQALIDFNWLWHHTLIYKTQQVCTPQSPKGVNTL